MGVLRDRSRRSLGGSAVLRGGTVMVKDIKITTTAVGSLTIGGSSDTVTIPGAFNTTGAISGGTIAATIGLVTLAAAGTSPAGGVLNTNGGIIVGNLGGTPRIFARVGGTTYQFSGIVL